ncbi:Probable conserved integral membrane protein [Mycobacteroides abscessus subsp. abscessus]|nr:Probable conserved integral membrane protein [Mycobacteroides abscessus subsp. abscessus]
MAWQFSANDPETREKVALRVIAFSFFALAAYVAVDSVRALAGLDQARQSTVGVALAAVSLVIMPALSWAQRRTGRVRFGGRRLQTDAVVHLSVCGPARRVVGQLSVRMVLG